MVRAGDHALVLRYMRGAAQWAVQHRRLRTVPGGRVDRAPPGRRTSAGLVGPPFQKFVIGNKRYLKGIPYCRLLCMHTRTPSGEQHRPPGRGEPIPPSELLGEEAGSFPFPRVCFFETYGLGRREVPRRFILGGGPPTLMGLALPFRFLLSPHIHGGRPR